MNFDFVFAVDSSKAVGRKITICAPNKENTNLIYSNQHQRLFASDCCIYNEL